MAKIRVDNEPSLAKALHEMVDRMLDTGDGLEIHTLNGVRDITKPGDVYRNWEPAGVGVVVIYNPRVVMDGSVEWRGCETLISYLRSEHLDDLGKGEGK